MVKATLVIVEDDTQVVSLTAEIDNFEQLHKIKDSIKAFLNDKSQATDVKPAPVQFVQAPDLAPATSAPQDMAPAQTTDAAQAIMK